MNISRAFSKLITRLLRGFLAESTPDSNNLRRLAAEANVLPLFVDMGGVFCINAAGDIISFSWDNMELPKVETDPRIRNIVLFQGSKKYPDLKGLIPEKPDEAITCPHCRGTGIESFSAMHNIDGVVCYCGGLGWIPNGNAERGTVIDESEDA